MLTFQSFYLRLWGAAVAHKVASSFVETANVLSQCSHSVPQRNRRVDHNVPHDSRRYPGVDW
eukprot:Nitzschia sp. Nitz4//scaffold109_size72162//22799//23059//NITZ4_005841-RA/size72162-est2genome-gene-0.50-mRNA-1//-1//CDS//3329532748//7326//frame0